MTAFRMALCAVSTAAVLATPAFAETKTWDYTGFDQIVSTQGVDVVVEVGPDYSIEVETEGDIDSARVELKGDRLILGRDNKGMKLRLGGARRLTYTVTMPELVAASASAGSDLEISGISGGEIELDASSGSDLEAEGTCDRLSADASSGADLMAGDLVCSDVRAEASSGAGIEVHATDSVRARASSGAGVVVTGDPSGRDVRKSSGGSVRFRN